MKKIYYPLYLLFTFTLFCCNEDDYSATNIEINENINLREISNMDDAPFNIQDTMTFTSDSRLHKLTNWIGGSTVNGITRYNSILYQFEAENNETINVYTKSIGYEYGEIASAIEENITLDENFSFLLTIENNKLIEFNNSLSKVEFNYNIDNKVNQVKCYRDFNNQGLELVSEYNLTYDENENVVRVDQSRNINGDIDDITYTFSHDEKLNPFNKIFKNSFVFTYVNRIEFNFLNFDGKIIANSLSKNNVTQVTSTLGNYLDNNFLYTYSNNYPITFKAEFSDFGDWQLKY